MTINKQALAFLGCSLALAAPLGACIGDEPESDDPAGDLGDEEWSDEGPLPGDESSDSDESVPYEAWWAAAPSFQVPFPCNQVWAGQTRTNHSPQNSVDFNRADDVGDTVVSSAAGTVTVVGNTGSTSYGRWIEVSHGNGYTTRYAHLSVQSVSVGQHVNQGQKLGNVGSTGGSTGPHLHFEERHNGAAIRARFDGVGALYFGTRNYTSHNACGGGGGNTASGVVNTAGAPLTVRAGTSTTTAAVGAVADGTHVTIQCQKHGQSITGTYGTTTLWDKIGTGYISDAYVSTGSDGQVAATCD